ncbi:hypothetical protein SXCC_04405 [Gluconacetobacter sp. SXCC-1]|nr:hypothetical protein SXCC_04405 [Gluconacetobacter sp. SXCC-1]
MEIRDDTLQFSRRFQERDIRFGQSPQSRTHNLWYRQPPVRHYMMVIYKKS